MAVIATAGWSISKAVAAHFPERGSALSRYAAVFRGAEVNTTFYRRHRRDTFTRWAQSVPADFRFALKMPQEISHVLKLSGIEPAFRLFLEDIAPLGEKTGPLLCQLPPWLTFDARNATEAFGIMRRLHKGTIVLEPRHKSWSGAAVRDLLRQYSIGRVLADPPVVWPAAEFEEPAAYMRLHGKPRIYHSSYTDDEVDELSGHLSRNGWCVFDNTASGEAMRNALATLERWQNQPGVAARSGT